MRKQQGFSFIELMIVLVIMLVLAAFAIPAYQRYVRLSEIDTLSNHMEIAKRVIRGEANRMLAQNIRCDSGSGPDLILILNQGNKKAVGNAVMPAFVVGAEPAAGQVGVDGLDENGCPERGTNITITAGTIGDSVAADYPADGTITLNMQ